jgi:tRNA-splicing ligase RtcB
MKHSAGDPLDNFPARVPWKSWGVGLEPQSVQQMEHACRLPVTAAGALMPDAHVGYGLPIGGVLATRGCVIPYAVGVDIACRMKLSVFDLPATALVHEHERQRLIRALEDETVFGVGGQRAQREQHDVLDRDWSVSPITLANKDRAWNQLGTSGSGNHFVEFGLLNVPDGANASAPDRATPASAMQASGGSGSFGFDSLAPGRYLALLSHSGSRGTGAAVCDRYSKLAMQAHPELPKQLAQLAWLDLSSHEGREYWDAMTLMGHYASANHAIIHRRIAGALGAEAIAGVENHHNFAWEERHAIEGRDEAVIVHRKGATPAQAGVLGVIPGSMIAPGFVVRGKGEATSLNSASHGAGRAMSRSQASRTLAWGNVKEQLADSGVQVLSAGIDEAPAVYKDIHAVMAQQQDLVDVVARFDPRIVKMAPSGEKAED